MRRNIWLVLWAGVALGLTGCSAGAGETDSNLPPLGDVTLNEDVRDGTVLVVGDSLAYALGQGMADVVAAGEARNLTVVNAAIGGCGILLPLEQEIGGTLGPTNPECNEWPTRWAELVQEYQPDYVYLTTSFWDVAPQVFAPGTEAITIDSPEVQDRYVANALEAGAVLTSGGAHLFLDDLNSDEMHEVQSRTVTQASSDSISLLSIRSQVCTLEGCPPTVDGIQVLDDTGHPAGESRDRLARWILNSMFTS